MIIHGAMGSTSSPGSRVSSLFSDDTNYSSSSDEADEAAKYHMKKVL